MNVVISIDWKIESFSKGANGYVPLRAQSEGEFSMEIENCLICIQKFKKTKRNRENEATKEVAS